MGKKKKHKQTARKQQQEINEKQGLKSPVDHMKQKHISNGRLDPLLIYILFLIIFGYTLCPGMGSGDSPEFIAAGSTFGIPHPPGYPFYTIMANLMCRILPAGSIALRINFLSAIYSATAVSMLSAVILLLTGSRTGAWFTAFCFGLGITVWGQSLIAEVYTLDAALLTGIILMLISGARSNTGTGTVRISYIIGAVIFLGLAMGHRNVNVMFLPVVTIAIYSIISPKSPGKHVWVLLIIIFCSGFLVYAYIPIASLFDPPVDTVNPENFNAFMEVVTASVYQKYFQSLNKIRLADHISGLLKTLPMQTGFLLFFIPAGIWWFLRNHKNILYLIGCAFAFDCLFICYYRIPDAHVLLIPSLILLCITGGCGAVLIIEIISERSSQQDKFFKFVFIFLGMLLGVFNFNNVNQHYNLLVDRFCKDALTTADETSVVLIIDVDTIAHGMMCIQDTEQFRTDLLLVAKGRGAQWYQEQCRTKRPELNVPVYGGPDAFNRWPAMLLEKFYNAPGVYLTAPVKGYFHYPSAAALDKKFGSLPAGFLFKSYARSSALSQQDQNILIGKNRRFWDYAWDNFTASTKVPDDPDMLALVLNYATYRQIFAEYAAMNGFWEVAIEASQSVLDLNPVPLLKRLNAIYGKQGKRYVMSDMIQRAQSILNRRLPSRMMF